MLTERSVGGREFQRRGAATEMSSGLASGKDLSGTVWFHEKRLSQITRTVPGYVDIRA